MPELDPTTKLPPPGHERKEELKKRTDKLQEAAETQMPEMETLPEKAFDPIREIQHALQTHSMHEVSNKQPGFVYSWVYDGQHGTEITSKKAVGWEVVQGDMPEAKELQHVDTTRKLADCRLMRISEERYQMLQDYDEYIRKSRTNAGDEEVLALGGKLGLNVEATSDAKSDIIKRFGGNRPAQLIVNAPGGPVERMLKDGTVPGMEVRR